MRNQQQIVTVGKPTLLWQVFGLLRKFVLPSIVADMLIKICSWLLFMVVVQSRIHFFHCVCHHKTRRYFMSITIKTKCLCNKCKMFTKG